MSKVTFKMTVATNVGLVRSNNEDNFIVCPDLSTKDNWYVPADPNEVIALGEYGCVMVVADGMGGMNAGEVASELAVNSIKETFSKVKDFTNIADCSNHIESFLKKAIVDADSVIKKRVKEDESTSGMGTTIVVAWVVGDVAHIAWCGDSRAYLFNRNAGLSRLSNDHSYVQELVDTGKLDPELAFDHPNSNIITRSLGDSSMKARPDYVCKRLSTGDYLLLCTDGLCGLCRDEEILDILMQEHSSLEDYRTSLFNAAFEAGGYDNVTIALMECMGVKEETLASTIAPSKPLKKRKIEVKSEDNKSDDNGLEKSVEKGTEKDNSVNKKLLTAVALLIIVGVALFFALSPKNSSADAEMEKPVVEEVAPAIEEEPIVDEQWGSSAEKDTQVKAIDIKELEAALNNSDGIIPPIIAQRATPKVKITVRNNKTTYDSLSVLFMDMYMGVWNEAKVINCKYDYNGRLTECIVELN